MAKLGCFWEWYCNRYPNTITSCSTMISVCCSLWHELGHDHAFYYGMHTFDHNIAANIQPILFLVSLLSYGIVLPLCAPKHMLFSWFQFEVAVSPSFFLVSDRSVTLPWTGVNQTLMENQIAAMLSKSRSIDGTPTSLLDLGTSVLSRSVLRSYELHACLL